MRGSFGRGFCDPTSVRSLESAKRWSEWQDLNLRPRVPKEVRYQGFSLELVGPIRRGLASFVADNASFVGLSARRY